MLLRSITMRNIRSYNDGEEATLIFPEGVVLLEGDVGSGKSSILYALEFALFGFSDTKGEHLLSEGKADGSVAVVIQAGGSVYKVERRLRRKGSEVTQDGCSITSDGQTARLSPSDLKERVVSILGFNEPTHPRAESLVYRYAVFTPQEQMKEILTRNSEERLHVIRRVLGAQTYQTAAENSATLEKRIDRTAYGLKSASADLGEKEASLSSLHTECASLESALPELRERQARAIEQLLTQEKAAEKLRAERAALESALRRASDLRRSVDELERDSLRDRDRASSLRSRMDALARDVVGDEMSARPTKGAEALAGEVGEARQHLSKLEGSKVAVEAELSRRRQLASAGVCPVCERALGSEFEERSRHLREDAGTLGAEMMASARLVSALEEEWSAARRYEENDKAKSEAVKERARLGDELLLLEERTDGEEARLKRLKDALAEEEHFLAGRADLEKSLESAENSLGAARLLEKREAESVVRAETMLAEKKARVAPLKDEIDRKTRDRQAATRLQQHADWLSSFFRPSVELIERQTLSDAASRFNEQFQRYFSSLVDDSYMQVRIDEDFSPVFEREGFEQDYDALSGGEKTSVALAYRFALNAVVKEELSGETELVILDEPTDGFSSEQVFRMRPLLETLDSRQVILVSHEKELESMADHVFRVEKRNGVSCVQKTM